MLALLSRVGYRPGSRRRPGPREEGLEAVDVDRRAVAHLARQGEGVGVGARAGGHREGAVPPRAQLTDVGGVEQLLGPQQHPVAHLEHRVDPARVELRLPLRLSRR